MVVLALVDADSLIYQSLREPFIGSFSVLEEKINTIIESTKCTHISFFLSEGNYFRKNISDGEYKKNREKTIQKPGVNTLKTFIKEFYHANTMGEVEADDLVAYWYNKPLFCIPELDYFATDCGIKNNESTDESSSYVGVKKIICSVDKDLLKGIPGTHFNYTYKMQNEEEVIKGHWEENTEEDAQLFLMKQMVVGDHADGVSGIPKKGEKYWENFYTLKGGEISWGNILNLYTESLGEINGVIQFGKNFRMLYTLRNDRDFLREVHAIPPIPNIVRVNNEPKDIEVYGEF